MSAKKPARELELLGADRSRIHHPENVTAIMIAPPPPPDLKGAAADAWNFLLPQLCGPRLVAPQDMILFRSLCRIHGEIAELEKQIDAEGSTYTTVSGLRKRNPASALLSDLRKEERALATAFGCSPVSRSSVATVPDSDEGGAANKWAVTDNPMDQWEMEDRARRFAKRRQHWAPIIAAERAAEKGGQGHE